jgi:hypothetical protein
MIEVRNLLRTTSISFMEHGAYIYGPHPSTLLQTHVLFHDKNIK